MSHSILRARRARRKEQDKKRAEKRVPLYKKRAENIARYASDAGAELVVLHLRKQDMARGCSFSDLRDGALDMNMLALDSGARVIIGHLQSLGFRVSFAVWREDTLKAAVTINGRAA